MDIHALRREFPLLDRQVHGKPLAYLDNAATTQKPRSVMEAETRFYEQSNANIHRGIHQLSEEATEQYEAVRAKVARLIGATETESVVFTRNTTESINLVAQGWARKRLKAQDEMVLSAVEHHSNLIPWQMAAQATGAKLRFIPMTPEGRFDLPAAEKLMTRRTKLVAVTAMSNVTGAITPVKALVARAHAIGARVLLDGAQSVPHLPTNVKELGCDFLAFSAHKMLGPTGVGVLFGRPDLLDEMDPLLGGGDMILEVWREKATWNELPWKLEAGTPNIAGVIGFGAAIDYLQAIGMDALRKHEEALTAYALKRLSAERSVQLVGPADPADRGGVLSFNLGSVHPHDIGTLMDQEGIAVRAGHHCCQPFMRERGIPGTVRASFYLYNTLEEIDRLVAALQKAQTLFAGVSV